NDFVDGDANKQGTFRKLAAPTEVTTDLIEEKEENGVAIATTKEAIDPFEKKDNNIIDTPIEENNIEKIALQPLDMKSTNANDAQISGKNFVSYLSLGASSDSESVTEEDSQSVLEGNSESVSEGDSEINSEI
ncbi:hypothetical protein Bhyg_07836, partial [Pseudolycoriella hygida]